MLRLQNGINVDEDEDASVEEDGTVESSDDCVKDLGIRRILEGLRTSPYVIGDLQVISLGKLSFEPLSCFVNQTMYLYVLSLARIHIK